MSQKYNPLDLAVRSVSKTRAGKVKSVTEYVDLTTGEVISAADAGIPVMDCRGLHGKREAALSSLRPEVREFAIFVLEYRNKRRGITPGVNTLCVWYAYLTGKRVDNVKRYICKLEAAGILVNEQLVGPLFQRGSGTRADAMHESSRAAVTFMTMHSTGKKGPLRRRVLEDGRVTPDVSPVRASERLDWLDTVIAEQDAMRAVTTQALARVRSLNATRLDAASCLA